VTAEELAGQIAEHLSETCDLIGGGIEQDMRSGGWFLDVDHEGEQFTILVTKGTAF
jgi:hypothetical protein